MLRCRNGKELMARHWYVMFINSASKGLRAGFIYTKRRNLHKRYKAGEIAEYRRCRSAFEAVGMVLIYNCVWAAWIYQKVMNQKK